MYIFYFCGCAFSKHELKLWARTRTPLHTYMNRGLRENIFKMKPITRRLVASMFIVHDDISDTTVTILRSILYTYICDTEQLEN